MSRYFVPDRSNRPKGGPHEYGDTRELDPNGDYRGKLADGRPYVRELAAVDLYTLELYYFDPLGLELATVSDLATLLRDSGIDWTSINRDTEFHLSARMAKDAQDRDIWEFQITYIPDW